MAAHRQKLKQQQEEALKKRDDELNSTKGDRFVMKQFQNVESKQFAGGRPVTTGRAGGIPRAPTANNQDD